MSNVKRTPHHEDAVLGEESMSHDNTVKFKVGDKVMLRPETKPYVFYYYGGEQINDRLNYRITHIYNEGNADIEAIDGSDFIEGASTHHLKHAKQDYNDNPYRFEYAVGSFDSSKSIYDLKELVIPKLPQSEMHDALKKQSDYPSLILPSDNEELRFMIYHSNPSRTLKEMKEIEKWLLGEK